MKGICTYITLFGEYNKQKALTETFEDITNIFKNYTFTIHNNIVQPNIYRMIFINYDTAKKYKDDSYIVDCIDRFFAEYNNSIYEINQEGLKILSNCHERNKQTLNICKQMKYKNCNICCKDIYTKCCQDIYSKDLQDRTIKLL